MIDTSDAQVLYDALIGAAAANATLADPSEQPEDLADPKDVADVCKAHAGAALPLVQAACTLAGAINSGRQGVRR